MKLFNKNTKYTLFFVLASFATVGNAQLLLTHEPLFLNQSVPPALAVTFDDSGSMAWSWMPDSRSFNRDRHSFASPDYNLIYFNPDINYPPPVRSDGTSLPQSNFFNASRDGYYTAGDFLFRVDLSRDYRVFRYYRPRYTSGPGNYSISYAQVGRANSRNPAFYYRWVGPASATLSDRRNQDANYQRIDIDINNIAERDNFANWYTYYNTRAKLARAAVSHAFVNFGPDFKIDWQQINNNRFRDKPTRMKLFSGNHRQDFYDWLFLVPSTGGTPLRRSTHDVGHLFSESGTGGPYYDAQYGGELSCQQNFHIAISDGSWNSSAGVSGNVDNNGVTLPLMPDNTTSYTYLPSTQPSKLYSDDNSSTLADNAFRYWSRDLRTDLPNNVPTYIDDYTDKDGNIVPVASNELWWEKPELFWNPNNDPASWQHMVNFNVGLGIEGSFNLETDLPKLRDGSLIWPDTESDSCFTRDPITNIETEVSCETHICYDVADSQVDCALDVAPNGPIVSCENLGTGSTIPCANRIVRYVNRSQGRVDDVWHSSINSRGKYFSAKNPQELSKALYDLVSNIIKRKGRASSGSVSSNILSDETLGFKTGYDTSDWSGFVTASPINSDGTLGNAIWDAGCKLTGGICNALPGAPTVSATNTNGSRNIFTFDYQSKTQHDFRSLSMSSQEQSKILNSSFYGTSLANGDVFTVDDIVEYVRGDRDLERQSGGLFRNRRSLLGDIIHSPAKIIRGPADNYLDSDNIWFDGTAEDVASDNGNGYSEYKNTNKDRDNILLVGANDGMLHAFDAGINTSNGGHELWAYVPSKVLDGLSEFANPAYKHTSFVDSSPTVKGVFFGNQWREVAVGGMRHGGKLFYALDLGNDPKQTPKVLWEFTDEDDLDMGFSYAGATVARVLLPQGTGMQSKWVAFLPNGYNSQNHKSVLYAVDIETGALLHKWDTGFGNVSKPNGMGPPLASDFVKYEDANTRVYDPRKDQAAEFIYAGDLYGNLYRFDVRDIGSTYSTSAPEIIYSGTRDKPITVAPRLFGIENDKVIAVFGTGKYIELPDRGVAAATPQYLLGVVDSDNPVSSPFSLNDSRLVEQNLSLDSTATLRTITENPVTGNDGWKIKLPIGGERLVSSIVPVNAAKAFFAGTIIPNGDDPCLPGGQSWLMFLDVRSGGVPKGGKVLANGSADGLYVDDMLTGINILTPPGGNSTIITIDGTGGADGNVDLDPILLNIGEKWRRRSWHRILFD